MMFSASAPAFFDELGATLEKVADDRGVLGTTADWIGAHPLISAGLTGALAAGGVVGHRLLQKAAPAAGPASARLRDIASKHGLGFGYEVGKNPNLLSRLAARVRLGGLKPLYTDVAGKPITKETFKGVSAGMPAGSSAAELQMGGGTKYEKAMEEMAQGGKVKEISKEVGLSHLFEPGQGIGEVMKKHKITAPSASASAKEKEKFFHDVQDALKKEYGKFVVKPHGLTASSGRFPTHEREWGELYADYKGRLEPKIEKFRDYMKAHPEKFQEWDPNVYIARKFRSDPTYAATTLEPMLKDPGRTLGQRMMNLVRHPVTGKPFEYRVHMIGGEIVPELAYNRYSPLRELAGRVPVVGGLFRRGAGGSSREAAEWAAQNVAPNIAKKYKSGTFGLDVIRVKNPDGSLGYKLVELNPSATESGVSGFLEPGLNPLAPHDVYRYIHGKSSPLITGAKALGAGGAVGTAGYAGSRLLTPDEK